MPRPKPEVELVPLSLRLKKTGVEMLDQIAEAQQMTRTDVIRAMLAKGVNDYRKGWRP